MGPGDKARPGGTAASLTFLFECVVSACHLTSSQCIALSAIQFCTIYQLSLQDKSAIFLLAVSCLLALVIEFSHLNSFSDCMAWCYSMSHVYIFIHLTQLL